MKRISPLALLLAAACSSGPEYSLSAEELLDPEACKSCHPNHYAEWAGSMHAYAADDPVFLAMNERGQRETGGELGDFCVGCHAPMAVRTGATFDGLNLDEVPQKLKGVTCYFCHSVDSVEGTHNNPLSIADDGVMRGSLRNPPPVDSGAHRMGYSPLHDSTRLSSSDLCGACHDIVTPAGVHLERTYLEWQESLYSNNVPGQYQSCNQCHMFAVEPGTVADFPGVPLRFPREHTFPGVDVAITPWPDKERQLEQIARDLFNTLGPTLCVSPAPGGYRVDYILDNVFAGHMWPSGAAQDRRAWAEIVAYDDEDQVVYQSGVVAQGQAVVEVAETDPDLWEIRDFTYDDQGQVAHMFWDVRTVDSRLLPPPVTADPNDPRFDHSVTRSYEVQGPPPARVTAVVHIRPMGLDILDDLIESGDLDPMFRDEMITHTLTGTALEWTSDFGFDCIEP